MEAPLSVCHYRPRNLILRAPILQYYCCLPPKGVKGALSVEWIGSGGWGVGGGGHSQFTQRVVGVLDYAMTVIIRAAD